MKLPRLPSAIRGLLISGAFGRASAGAWFASMVLTVAPAARADPIDELLQRLARDGHIPGLAVAVLRDGKIIKAGGYGTANVENAVPVTLSTRFQIASTTKLFTSMLLLRMVADGSVRLDDSIGKYISGAPKAWQAIRVRDLAAHVSGLGAPDIDARVVKTEDAVAVLKKAAPAGRPGEVARYDSMDFTVLQLVLERAGGKPFAALLQEKWLAPAGMRCTSFDNAVQMGPQRRADLVPDRAEYYHWNGTANQRAWFLYTQYAYAAGGAYSCLNDMSRFLALVDGGQLVSAAALAAAWTPPVLRDGSAGPYGLGWVVKSYRGQRWVGHSGGPALSDFMYFPALHLGIVVLANQQRLYPQIASLVADRYIAAPGFYGDAGLADRNAALTDRARRFLEGAAAGHVDATLLQAKGRDDTAQDWNDAGPGWIGLLGPVTRMVLVREASAPGGGVTRSYRAFYGGHAEGFTFVFDTAGEIADVDTAEVK